MSKTKKENYYFDNKKFIELLKIYYETNNKKTLNELSNIIIQLSNNIASRYNFNNYTYKEEMVGDGILVATKALLSKKINVLEPSNPYGYLTKIIMRCFQHRLNQEALLENTRKKYLNNYQITNYDTDQYGIIEEAKMENDYYVINDLWNEKDNKENYKKNRKEHFLNIERRYNKPFLPSEKDKEEEHKKTNKISYYDIYRCDRINLN